MSEAPMLTREQALELQRNEYIKQIAALRAKVEELEKDKIDPGCSMAARIDCGHGVNGECDIRKEKCPPLCLLKQIRSREANENGLQLQIDAFTAALLQAKHEAFEEAAVEVRKAHTKFGGGEAMTAITDAIILFLHEEAERQTRQRAKEGA